MRMIDSKSDFFPFLLVPCPDAPEATSTSASFNVSAMRTLPFDSPSEGHEREPRQNPLTAPASDPTDIDSLPAISDPSSVQPLATCNDALSHFSLAFNRTCSAASTGRAERRGEQASATVDDGTSTKRYRVTARYGSSPT